MMRWSAVLVADFALAHDCHVAKLKAGDTCSLKWGDAMSVLRPTQRSVGFSWVDSIFARGFGSKKQAQSTMDANHIPVVVAGGDELYVVDKHHHLAALALSGHASVEVTASVVCALKNATGDALWRGLASLGYAYLYDRPADEPDALPRAGPLPSSPNASFPTVFAHSATSSVFVDDRWRSLAGFARKIVGECGSGDRYCDRCYDRTCDDTTGDAVPYFEYRWAYFFDDAYGNNASLWGRAEDFAAFAAAYRDLPFALPGTADSVAWGAAAAALLPLCRGPSASAYRLPATGVLSGPLPGASAARIPHPDADCASPRC